MHQTPRSAQRAFSPASSPQTNPTRTNNQRDPTSPVIGSPRPSLDVEARTENATGIPRPSSERERTQGGPSKDSVKKLDQIIQNVYSKAGTIILQERMLVTPTLVGRTQEKKTSRWFQLDTDDIDDFKEEFRVWKQCGGFDHRPPPLVIETYIDTSRLRSGESLVILDEHGKRWDVSEALNDQEASSDSGSGWPSKPNHHVILERWKVDLRGAVPDHPDEFGALLPTIYKKAIVLCRSIFTTTGILPAWKLARKSKTQGIHPACQVRCRVRSSESLGSGYDSLRTPLFDGAGDVTTDYMFGQLEVPVGRFYVSVSYRNHCNFQVVETESLLSSRIGIAISDDMFKPSLPHRTQTEYARANQRALEAGSVPYSRQAANITDNQQRYGSLSTFHGEGPTGTSPISALKAVKAPDSDTSSPPGSRPESIEPPRHSLPITGPTRRPSMRNAGTSDSHGRRPSVSFQSSPFKHGSLSGSPGRRLHGDEVPSSPHSLSRLSGPGTLTHTRNRSSLTAGMPASLRGGPPQPSTDSFVAGSPRPSVTNRFSSSFSHRRSRTSFGGASRVGDDDQSSSGKQSLASSLAQPGSGLLNEAGAGGSSGSFQTDDDNIQDFLKALDSKKTLQSFEPSTKGDSATSRTRAQLNKFHLMRESNNALTDSLNSSTQLQAPSSVSSRHMANVPGMSTSSSPGKPLSPHTPHTPAVPSRLSENSSIDHEPAVRDTSTTARAPTSAAGTTAIDIPISPRPYTHARRSSSAAQKHRVLADDDDQRSVSLGTDDREPPSLSALLGRNMASGLDEEGEVSPALQPPADIIATDSPSAAGSGSASEERETRPPGGLYSGYSSSPYGRRYGSSAGRGVTPPQSGSGSLAGSSTGRYGRGYTQEPEEEPLLFDMSEINRDQSRRSIEEGRGGGSLGSGSVSDRGAAGAYEAAHRQRRWQ
ncbi:autophagy-related protein 13-domain-containing protein [Microdochium bolleyi]|uniref:Autophagy-related protein 13 n=1 Tax=Microdochium bolleyi TaxID=196109 RepID=A0A136IXX5_9PEZI|nr:autophagy-related protein 13-domain-containing protein [Microdochium bolleyi]